MNKPITHLLSSLRCPGWRLRVAIFLAGASVMELQVLGTRIIGPHFGVGLYVWTSLITVTLLALALGYWFGGALADQRPQPIWLAGILLAAAGAVALIPLFRESALNAGWALGLRAGSILASTTLFLPSLLLLGMVSPYAIRLEAKGVAGAGRSAGRLYAISTAGSVVGVLLGGFVFVPNFRVPVLLFFISSTLILAALLVAIPTGKKSILLPSALLLMFSLGLARPRAMPPSLLAASSYDGTDLRVVVDGGNRYLMVDQTVQSSMNQEGRPLDKYSYIMASRVLQARPEAKRAVLVGLGGGGIPKILEGKGLTFDCVEISPKVVDLARTFFGFVAPAEKVHLMDGRVFLRMHPHEFDLVFLDAFQGDRLAYTLVSEEGLTVARSALTPGGLLILNSWGVNEKEGRPNLVGAALRETLLEVFSYVQTVPVGGNLLFFASPSPISKKINSVELAAFDGIRQFPWLEIPEAEWPESIPLKDDWNPVDLMNLFDREKLRVAQRNRIPSGVKKAVDWE